MSAFASLSLLVAASFAAQDTNKLVSAEVRAAAAPAAIAELSKQIGFPLEAMPSTKDDILVIRVNKVSIKDLMEKISGTLNAEWEQTSTGYRLIRNDQIRRKEQQEEEARLAERIRASMEKMSKRIAEDGAMTARQAELAAERLQAIHERRMVGQPVNDWRQEQQIRQQAPIYRVMRGLVPKLSPELLASIPRGRSLVFATNPTRMQRPMPVDVVRHLQPFLAEQKIWAQAFKAARDKRGNQDHFYYDESSFDPSDRKIGKTLLKITRNPQGMGLSMRIVVSDTKGRAMASGQDQLGWNWDEYNELVAKSNQGDPNEESIKFSGTSRDIADAIKQAAEKSMNGRREVSFDFPPNVREALLHVDKHEPLSFMTTDILFEVGRIRNLNVVACPSDDLIMISNFNQGKEMKPSSFLAMTKAFSSKIDIDKGWLLFRPLEPSAARERRSDRVALANFLRRAVKEGRLTLENRASYALASGKEDDDYMALSFLSFQNMVQQDWADWGALRLYATLTPNQWRAIKANQPIPFRSLQPIQLEIIRHMVFDKEYSPLQMTYTQEDMADLGTEEGVIYGGGLDQEPTEILPNGFTGEEVLTVNDLLEQSLFGKPEEDGSNQHIYWGESVLNPESLAHELFQDERPEFFPWRNQPGFTRPKISKYRVGTNRQINFQVQFTKRAQMYIHLSEKTYASGEAVTVDKLPEEIRKRIQDALARVRESYKNQKPPTYQGGGGGAIPPPPPAAN